MQSYPYEFETVVERHGIGKTKRIYYVVVFLDPDLVSLMPFDLWPRLRIEGEINDYPFEAAWIPDGGGIYYMIVPKSVLRDSGLAIGDPVAVRFAIDDQDRVGIPAALQSALAKDKAFEALFDKATAGTKRGFSHHVGSAKTEVTIARRVADVHDALRFGCSLRDLKSVRATRQSGSNS